MKKGSDIADAISVSFGLFMHNFSRFLHIFAVLIWQAQVCVCAILKAFTISVNDDRPADGAIAHRAWAVSTEAMSRSDNISGK